MEMRRKKVTIGTNAVGMVLMVIILICLSINLNNIENFLWKAVPKYADFLLAILSLGCIALFVINCKFAVKAYEDLKEAKERQKANAFAEEMLSGTDMVEIIPKYYAKLISSIINNGGTYDQKNIYYARLAVPEDFKGLSVKEQMRPENSLAIIIEDDSDERGYVRHKDDISVWLEVQFKGTDNAIIESRRKLVTAYEIFRDYQIV